MKEEKTKKDGKKPLDSYLRYSAMGFQMAAIIGGGAWLGHWLDGRDAREFPLYTLCITLFAIFAALYLVLKEFIGKK